MDKLASLTLILLIANKIYITKADFFLDDIFGDRFTDVDNHGVSSVFSRNHNPYDRDTSSSFGLGLSPPPYNGENDFEAQNRVDFFPGAQIHRHKESKKHLQRQNKGVWDEKQGKYIKTGEIRTEKWILKREDDKKKQAAIKKMEDKKIVTTEPPYKIRTRRPSRFFNVYRRYDEYNKYEKGDFWGKVPEDKN